MNLILIINIFLIILLIVTLIIHIIYFLFNNSDYVNLKKNRKLDSIKYINCDKENIKDITIKEIYLTNSKTRFTNSYNNFITHYDFLLKDEKNNMYLLYTITEKTRYLNVVFILKEKYNKICNKNKIIYNDEIFYINPKKYLIDFKLKDFIEIYNLNEYGYHIFYLNCHHKAKSLINIMCDKKEFEIKKYNLGYCIWEILKSIL